jgi:UDP-glucose 4-epimerase
VIYPSSSAVYGRALQTDDAGALQEGMFSPQNPNWYAPDEMYGFTKLAGEMLAWKAATYGLDSLCIRPFSGYGEGQSFDYPVPSIARRALLKEDPLTIWGSGHQTRDFIHVSDLVAGTLKRLDYPLKGYDTMNLGSGHPITFRVVAEIFAELVGYAPAIVTDETKPEGVKRRWADTGRMSFYHEPQVRLREGLSRVLADVERRLGVPA